MGVNYPKMELKYLSSFRFVCKFLSLRLYFFLRVLHLNSLPSPFSFPLSLPPTPKLFFVHRQWFGLPQTYYGH